MRKTDFIHLNEADQLRSALAGIAQSLRLIEGFAKEILPESLIREGLNAGLKELREEINRSGQVTMNYRTSIGFFDTSTRSSDINVYRLIFDTMEIGITHFLSRNIIFSLRRDNNQLFLTVNFASGLTDKNMLVDRASLVLEKLTERFSSSSGTVAQLPSEEGRYEYLIFCQIGELNL